MRIRTKFTLWFSGILFAALVAMSALAYRELVMEPRNKVISGRATAAQELAENGGEDILSALLWCGVPALLLALGGGWWLMRSALAPVAALTRAAEHLNERNLGQTLPRTRNHDELDRLTDVFNAMSERLAQSFQRVREFTLHASHELKTPLTVMRGELETELQNGTLSAERRTQVESTLDELERLARIVDGLSLLTKADAGLVTLNLQPLSLAELVRECFADAQILAHDSGLNVTLPACDEVTVRGDAHRLRQLLLNLADNAVKYNQAGGSITMALRRDGTMAAFSIANTGPGIAAERLPKVFERFYRGDVSHSSSVEGCGLGLSIAQWIVSAHGGTIAIASDPSHLTTVSVRLPEASQETRP
jgi:signal transduction histidine kinase